MRDRQQDEPILRCSCCGCEIYAGQKVFEILEHPFCEDCVTPMSADDFLAYYSPLEVRA